MATILNASASAAPSATAIRSLPFPTTTTIDIDVDDVEEDVHEFVVIYEGPPGRKKKDDDDDHDEKKNRQVYSLSLPPTGILSGTKSSSSYVSEDDLLESLASRIGWPSSFLCVVRGRRSSSSSSTTPLLFFPPDRQPAAYPDDDPDGVRCRRLRHHHHHHHHHHPVLFASLVPRLTSVRGGKGGFGTLLRGQSKQAGARTTVDFGACRDLSGRRLRHVNDEIKLRKWRELQNDRIARKGVEGGGDHDDDDDDRGDASTAAELAALRTPSGIRNWHLAVPSWSEYGGSSSMKGRRKVERQLENEARGWKAREDRAIDERERKRTETERAVTDYVRRGEEEGARIAVGESVKEGILAHYRKRRERMRGDGADAGVTTTVANDDKRPTTSADGVAAAGTHYLMTLSGEMSAFDLPLDDDATATTATTATTTTTKLRIVSQSDFATAVVLLNSDKTKDMRGRGAYVEYTLRTAGLAQIGWARVGVEGETSGGGGGAFLPNSDTGDGVGDDDASYGYDGSRGLVFHGGKELAYGSQSSRGGDASVEWKAGDVLGCYCKFGNGTVEIGYSMNGKDLGRAFAVSNADGAFRFYPAISLNLNEVVDVNIGPDFAYFDPRGGCAGVYELVGNEANDTGDDVGDGNDDEEDSSKQTDDTRDPPKKRSRDESLTGQSAANEIKDAAKEGKDAKPSKPIANFDSFDLNKCCSVDELQDLGSERLKGIMLSMGVKCGGTLDERATRLFSLKGLRRDEYPKKVRGKNFIS